MKCILFLLLMVFSSNCRAESKLLSKTLHSQSLGVMKNYYIYLPKGYYEQAKTKYPVVYLIHGLGVGEDSWVRMGIKQIADQMNIRSIIVIPDGDRGLYINGVNTIDFEACMHEKKPYKKNPNENRASFCVKTPKYESFITSDLREHLESNFRVIDNRNGRALIGESAGGYGALILAMRNAHLFSSVASHSGFAKIDFDGSQPNKKSIFFPVLGIDIDRWKKHDPYHLVENIHPGVLNIYFDCGRQDEFGFWALNNSLHQKMEELNLKHTFASPEGTHNEELFIKQVKVSLKFHEDHFYKRN